jgi:transposase
LASILAWRLYRQARIYARQGVDLDRSTLADLGRPCRLAPAPAAQAPPHEAQGIAQAVRR